MKTIKAILAGLLVLSFAGVSQADVIGNKASKMFFPDTCSYAKKVKKENVVNFKSVADAIAAGYKESSKCEKQAAAAAVAGPTFVGNKDSKLYFPSDCYVVKTIKDSNKVSFNSAANAQAAGYKASSKCTDKK